MLSAMPQRLGALVAMPRLPGGKAAFVLPTDPEASLPSHLLGAILEEAAVQSANSMLGFTLGLGASCSHMGLAGLHLAHAATLRQAVLALVNQHPRFCIGVPYLVEEADGLVIGFEPLHGGHQLGLAGAGFCLALLREIAGVEPCRVHLSGCYGLEYAHSVLDAPLPAASRERQEAVLLAMRASRLPVRADIAGDCVRVIVRLLHQRALRADLVADGMAMHRRTLNRHLRQRGTHVRALMEAVRFEVAASRMRGSSMNITAIADLVGYHEAGSFTRWFRSRAGVAPQQWRARVRACPPTPVRQPCGAQSSIPRLWE